MCKPLMARKSDDGSLQTLQQHLHETSALAAGFESQYAATARLVGEIHDAGKASQQFQRYLLQGVGKRGEIPHAKQGAFAISDIDAAGNPFILVTQEIVEAVVSAHHGDLPDCLDPQGERMFAEQMSAEAKIDPKYHWDEVKRNIPRLGIALREDFDSSVKDTEALTKTIQKYAVLSKCPKQSLQFAWGLYFKYIYSRLVDADRFDAMCFEKGIYPKDETISWKRYIDHFESYISKFTSHSPINDMRSRISQACLEASNKPTGIYRLTVPTGGGKTLASLRFALHHAQRTGKRHIIYVSSYLTITGQTAATFRDALGIPDASDALLEHYSSVSISDDENDEERENRRLAAERWANPFIVTTTVQFLETVMASHGTKLRKFHNMANSVIIFDEVQSLPFNTVNLFNEVVSFLSHVLGSTIILCTATQPLIDKTERKNLILGDDPELIEVTSQDLAQSRRTDIIASLAEKSVEQFADEVLAKAREQGNCLAIVNLKSQARAIFRHLEESGAGNEFELVHLSTSMYGAHRKRQITRTRELLDEGKPVICVSTQLIEAGVDISFNCVVRAMAGLDSILQAAGRCNRNGESVTPRPVYVYRIADEKGLEHLPDIYDGKEITGKLLHDYPNEDPQSQFMIEKFYERYFNKRATDHYMDYQLKDVGAGTSMYDLLSCNPMGRGSYCNRVGAQYPHMFAQAFRTAGSWFKVIDQQTKNVVVGCDESLRYLAQLQDDDFRIKLDALRHLQEYTVSLFPYEYNSLARQDAIYQVSEDFDVYLLNDDFYSQDYGVVTEPLGLSPRFLME